jgi:pilus assembly protein CpaF
VSRPASVVTEHAVAAVRSALVDAGEDVDRDAVRDVVLRSYPLLAPDTTEGVVDDVLATVRGMGPLEPLLSDASVTDVLVNGAGPVWVERRGRLEKSGVVVSSHAEVMRLIERAVAPLGLRIDASSPYVDARLADGSRLHASIPPIAVDGPCLAIRRFAAGGLSIDELVEPDAVARLRAAVRERQTIVVSGGTGAGKTTLLNALAREIDDAERVITIEDTAELRTSKPHVVRLEARPANADGIGEITIRDLVRNALRMRPDRIIVGECRGGEAFDMLQAINTGHLGSMTTCHANSAADALVRLESMVLLAGTGIPPREIRRQLSRAIDVIVHLTRDSDGTRRVEEITQP